jgi:hypothetical protein
MDLKTMLMATSKGSDIYIGELVSSSFVYTKALNLLGTSLQYISPDGVKVYTMTQGNTVDELYEYSLSTPYDITTASLSFAYPFATIDDTMEAITFSFDGMYMFMCGNTNDLIHRVNLSTSFDLSTAGSTPSQTYDPIVSRPSGLQISQNGTKMYVQGRTSDVVKQLNLSTPNSIGTGVTVDGSFDTSTPTGEGSAEHSFLSNDGKVYLIVGSDLDTFIHRFIMTTPFDITTMSYDTSLDFSPTVFNTSLVFADSSEDGYYTRFYADSGVGIGYIEQFNIK